jgi:succinate dehydrogenase hydrophobic anchor subunit
VELLQQQRNILVCIIYLSTAMIHAMVEQRHIIVDTVDDGTRFFDMGTKSLFYALCLVATD